MSSLFIIYSAYHFYTAWGLARHSHRGEENHLIVVADFNNACCLAEAISKGGRSPFAGVSLLAGMFAPVSRAGAVSRAMANRRAVGEYCRGRTFDRIYAFNDSRIETQTAMHILKPRGAECIYVEDGTGTYGDTFMPNLDPFSNALRKLLFGLWWQPVRVMGASRFTDRMLALFPDMVRPELAGVRCGRLDREAFDRDLALEMLEMYGESGKAFRWAAESARAVFLMPHSGYGLSKPGRIDSLRRLISLLPCPMETVAFKFHPRETKGNFVEDMTGVEIRVLPCEIPAELAFLANPDLLCVIGDVSGGLMTSRWLNPGTRAISTMKLIDYEQPALVSFFSEIGIEVPGSLSEYEHLVRVLKEPETTS